MPGSEVTVDYNGRTLHPWLPDRLSERTDLTLSNTRAVRATEQAKQLLISADQHTPVQWEPLARLLLRAEGVASSYIEGVQASAAAVAWAQQDPADAQGSAEGWVAANLNVLDAALEHAHTSTNLTLDTLNSWHRRLMAGFTTLKPEAVGALRTEQGWIGGPDPFRAALVTAPVDALPTLVEDLLDYANRTDLNTDPITQAAITHAQFEVIHPYGDGNGRLGRILILWVLARRLGIRVLPPISAYIAIERGAYLAELTNYRLATATSWVRWFADTVSTASAAVESTLASLHNLEAAWTEQLDTAGVRQDASARRLLTHLPSNPVMSADIAADLVGVTTRAATTALRTLADAGVVAPFELPGSARRERGRQRQWWVATGVTALIQR